MHSLSMALRPSSDVVARPGKCHCCLISSSHHRLLTETQPALRLYIDADRVELSMVTPVGCDIKKGV